ncbi:MAG: hypothetical protein M1827_005204 [Pycnora praestabilis]|nr:MAG: hypothetical protein M1827_005204 [Pycnora praestabilis]
MSPSSHPQDKEGKHEYDSDTIDPALVRMTTPFLPMAAEVSYPALFGINTEGAGTVPNLPFGWNPFGSLPRDDDDYDSDEGVQVPFPPTRPSPYAYQATAKQFVDENSEQRSAYETSVAPPQASHSGEGVSQVSIREDRDIDDVVDNGEKERTYGILRELIEGDPRVQIESYVDDDEAIVNFHKYRLPIPTDGITSDHRLTPAYHDRQLKITEDVRQSFSGQVNAKHTSRREVWKFRAREDFYLWARDVQGWSDSEAATQFAATFGVGVPSDNAVNIQYGRAVDRRNGEALWPIEDKHQDVIAADIDIQIRALYAAVTQIEAEEGRPLNRIGRKGVHTDGQGRWKWQSIKTSMPRYGSTQKHATHAVYCKWTQTNNPRTYISRTPFPSYPLTSSARGNNASRVDDN